MGWVAGHELGLVIGMACLFVEEKTPKRLIANNFFSAMLDKDARVARSQGRRRGLVWSGSSVGQVGIRKEYGGIMKARVKAKVRCPSSA